jgi:flagella basal body P-ring formation protein FlgA
MNKLRFLLFIVLAAPTALAAPTQSLPAIQDAVNDFVVAQLDPRGDYQINIAQIDPRLQLPACEKSLDIFPQSGAIKPGRNTIGIRCPSSSSWTIYSTVVVRSFETVLVLSKQLARHERISQAHFTAETRDTSTLQQGYITDPQDILGKQAIRFMPAGSVVYSAFVSEPTMVRRGERVSIQSGKPGLLITSTGVALMDGIKGQKISVKNASSHRVIQATVVASDVVTVIF